MSDSATATKLEVARELERIEDLAIWAFEDGDSDVLAVCDAAFAGDTSAWYQALDWWSAWERTHRRVS